MVLDSVQVLSGGECCLNTVVLAYEESVVLQAQSFTSSIGFRHHQYYAPWVNIEIAVQLCEIGQLTAPSTLHKKGTVVRGTLIILKRYFSMVCDASTEDQF